jgi:hypothetical protein
MTYPGFEPGPMGFKSAMLPTEPWRPLFLVYFYLYLYVKTEPYFTLFNKTIFFSPYFTHDITSHLDSEIGPDGNGRSFCIILLISADLNFAIAPMAAISPYLSLNKTLFKTRV